MTLAELISAMEDADGPDYAFKDWLEILRLFQEIFNDAGLISVSGAIGGLIASVFAARSNHNSLALQAMQATALRGIQNAIAPPKDPDTEETTVQGWMDTLEKIPFLTTAIVAIVDPSPTGEGAMAVKIALTIKNLATTAFGWISDWWNTYVSTVGNPQPAGTVVGMLSEISRKIQSLNDETATPTVTVSNRLKAISDAIEGIETQGVDLTPTLQEVVVALNGIALPEGVTWQGLFDGLAIDLGEEMAITVNVTCSSCGSSGGCGCGGSGSGAYGPGVSGPEDRPPTTVVSGQIPTGFPDPGAYSDYKCKAANVLVINLAEMLAQTAEVEMMNLSQYTTYSAAMLQVTITTNLVALSGGALLPQAAEWYADKIMSFVWPYFNEDSIGLAIFEGIRLDYLTDRQDAVCELFNSYNTGDARTAIETRIDGYIDSTSYTSDVKNTAKEMYKGLLSNTWLNRLFEKDTMVANYNDASAIDCSECVGDVIFYIEEHFCNPEVSNETGHFSNNTTIQVSGCFGNIAGADRYMFTAHSSPYVDNVDRRITLSNIDPGTYQVDWASEDLEGQQTEQYNDSEMEGLQIDCYALSLVRFVDLTTPFTVTMNAQVIV